MQDLTLVVLALAAVCGGYLAGAGFDRAFVAMPAWQRVGAGAWARFSRRADLGNGLLVYPAAAFGATLGTLAALLLHFFATGTDGGTLILAAAFGLNALGLILTLKAAPIMLTLRHQSAPGELDAAFSGFRQWGNYRSVCQILGFFCQLWALAILR